MSTLRTSLAGAAAAVVLTGAATGCGGGSAATGAVASAAQNTSSVPAFHLSRNARKAVTVRSCVAHPGGTWSMSGTIRDSGSKPAGYTLVVDFVKVPGNTVVHTSVLHVPEVSPGKSAAWIARGGKASQKLGCVLRYAQTAS